MTVREAAEELELSVTSVYRMIALGDLPASRRGPKRGKVVIDPADVEDYKTRSAQVVHDIQVGDDLEFIKLA